MYIYIVRPILILRRASLPPHAAGPHAAFGVDAPCHRTRIAPSAHAHTAVDTQPRVLPSVLRSPRGPVRPSRPLRGPNAARTGLPAPFGVDPTARRAVRTLRAYPKPSVDSQRRDIAWHSMRLHLLRAARCLGRIVTFLLATRDAFLCVVMRFCPFMMPQPSPPSINDAA